MTLSRKPGDVFSSLSSTTDNRLVRTDGTTGHIVQDTGITVDDSNNVTGVNNVTGSDTNFVTGTAGTSGNVVQWDANGDAIDSGVTAASITNAVTATSTIADNTIVRGDGGSRGAQSSGVSIDDSDNITGVANLTTTGNATIGADIVFNTTNGDVRVDSGGDAASQLDFDFPSLSTQAGTIRVFRDTNTSAVSRFVVFAGDGTGTESVVLSSDGIISLTGTLRLDNNKAIQGRNFADTAYWNLFRLNASDAVNFGDATVSAITFSGDSVSTLCYMDSAGLDIKSGGLDINATEVITSGRALQNVTSINTTGNLTASGSSHTIGGAQASTLMHLEADTVGGAATQRIYHQDAGTSRVEVVESDGGGGYRGGVFQYNGSDNRIGLGVLDNGVYTLPLTFERDELLKNNMLRFETGSGSQSRLVVNDDNLDVDFLIQKNTSGTAFQFIAGTDTITIGAGTLDITNGIQIGGTSVITSGRAIENVTTVTGSGVATSSSVVLTSSGDQSVTMQESGSERARIVYRTSTNDLAYQITDNASGRIIYATVTGEAALASRNMTYQNLNSIIYNAPLVFYNRTDANRGAAGTAGRVIFNTDDGNLNIDDGTNWILPDGTTT